MREVTDHEHNLLVESQVQATLRPFGGVATKLNSPVCSPLAIIGDMIGDGEYTLLCNTWCH